MKKLVSVVLTVAMLLQCAVFVHGEDSAIYTDNFSAYTDGSTGDSFGKLESNGRGSGTVGSTLAIAVQDGQTFLKVPAGISQEQARKYTVAQYTETVSGEKKLLTVVLDKKTNVVSGVRFYMHNSNKDYYELSFDTNAAWTLTKSVNNARTELAKSETAASVNAGLYTLEMVYDASTLSWRMQDETGALKAGDQDLGAGWKTQTISNAFTAQDAVTFGLLAGGGVEDYAGYTNLSIAESDGTLPGGGEPDDGDDGNTDADAWVYTYTDDFSSYTANSLSMEIGPWKSNGKTGTLQALGAELKTESATFNNETKAAMCVPATELYSNPGNFTAAILQDEIVSGGKMEFEYTTKKDQELVTAFRFMVHNNNANYYELTINRNGNNDPGWSLIKCTNNGRTTLVSGTAEKYIIHDDLKVKITYDYADYAGQISWKIAPAAGGTLMYNGNVAVSNASGSYEDIAPFKGIGTSTVALVGGAQNAKYVRFTDLSIRATESHEEKALDENDPESVAQYLARQNEIIAVYNSAIENQSAYSLAQFLTSQEKLALCRMDRVEVSGISGLTETELMEYAERLLSYPDAIVFETLADLEIFESHLNKELLTGKLCNVTDTAIMISLINKNADTLGIERNSFYETMQEDVAALLLERSYENAADFQNAFAEAVVLANYAYTANAEYLVTILEAYPDVIGYDAEHFETIYKEGLAKELLTEANKQEITDLEKLAAYIDAYTETEPEEEEEPTPTPKPSKTGGGGGGSSPVMIVRPATTEVPTTANDVTSPLVDKAAIYPDVPAEYWAYEAVRYMNAKKAVSGYEDGTFRPEGNITRAEFLTMLMGVYGFTAPETYPEELGFADISETDWYYTSIMTAANLGIMSGDGGYAYPARQITRQEMAVLICKAMEASGFVINADTGLARFTDDAEIDTWAFASVKKLQAGGVVSGSDGYFAPKSNAKRSEAAQMLYMATNTTEKTVQEEVTGDENA